MEILINKVGCIIRSASSIIFMLLVINVTQAKEQYQVNVLDENKNIITRYFEEVWNQGKIEVLNELLSPEYINHNPGFESPKPGPDDLKPIVSAMRKGFPNLKYIIDKMVVSNDYVAVYLIMTGTHTSDFFGIAPTGTKIEVYQMQFERIANGKMIEHCRVTDDLTMMRQLGEIQ